MLAERLRLTMTNIAVKMKAMTMLIQTGISSMKPLSSHTASEMLTAV